MNAAEKINQEMQKDPSDEVMEILGHYLIDRCSDPADEALIGVEGKSLTAALKEVENYARKKAKNGRAAVAPYQVFNIVDAYFGLSTNESARASAFLGANPAPESAPLSLEDFL